jgi:hypothetical protein
MTGNTMPNKKSLKISRGNQNGKSHDRQSNDQQEKFEDITGVIRTVTNMTGNTMTNKKSFEDIKRVIRTVNHITGNTMTNKKSLKISKW